MQWVYLWDSLVNMLAKTWALQSEQLSVHSKVREWVILEHTSEIASDEPREVKLER